MTEEHIKKLQEMTLNEIIFHAKTRIFKDLPDDFKNEVQENAKKICDVLSIGIEEGLVKRAPIMEDGVFKIKVSTSDRKLRRDLYKCIRRMPTMNFNLEDAYLDFIMRTKYAIMFYGIDRVNERLGTIADLYLDIFENRSSDIKLFEQLKQDHSYFTDCIKDIVQDIAKTTSIYYDFELDCLAIPHNQEYKLDGYIALLEGIVSEMFPMAQKVFVTHNISRDSYNIYIKVDDQQRRSFLV